MAATFNEKKTALEWMINHYQEAADKCNCDDYDNLAQYYLIYDYNLSKVSEYKQMLENLLKSNN